MTRGHAPDIESAAEGVCVGSVAGAAAVVLEALAGLRPLGGGSVTVDGEPLAAAVAQGWVGLRQPRLRARRVSDRGGEPGGDPARGQQQRVAIARALVLRPRLLVLVLDDPTSELDPDSAQLIADVLTRAAQHGACGVLATDDQPLVAACSLAIPAPASAAAALEPRLPS